MAYRTTVLIVGLVALTIILGVATYATVYGGKKLSYPPVVPDCPDYWQQQDTEHGTYCSNVLGLGSITDENTYSSAAPVVNETQDDTMEKTLCGGFYKKAFDKMTFTQKIKEQNEYARGCGVAWDGVTNNTVLKL